MSDLQKLYQEFSDWSQKTFQSDSERGPTGPINHLKKEIEELAANPTDRMEYADCFLLLVDAYRRAGLGDISSLIKDVRAKFEICKERKWGEINKDGFYQHIKE